MENLVKIVLFHPTGFQQGLMSAVLDRDEQGNLIRKAGVMGIILENGEVKVGDTILVELPGEPHILLVPVQEFSGWISEFRSSKGMNLTVGFILANGLPNKHMQGTPRAALFVEN